MNWKKLCVFKTLEYEKVLLSFIQVVVYFLSCAFTAV